MNYSISSKSSYKEILTYQIHSYIITKCIEEKKKPNMSQNHQILSYFNLHHPCIMGFWAGDPLHSTHYPHQSLPIHVKNYNLTRNIYKM